MRKILVVSVILLMAASSGCSNEKNISKEAELESYINSKDNKQKKIRLLSIIL